MTTYKLQLNISSKDLNNFRATNSKVAIAKPVTGANADLMWQVFTPFEANSITFENQYGMYVSNADSNNAEDIFQLSRSTISEEGPKEYTMEAFGMITVSGDAPQANRYALKNQYTEMPYLTVGLYQNATVNGTLISNNPISANKVLSLSTIDIEPALDLYIWIYSDMKSEMRMRDINAPKTEVSFSNSQLEIALVYDASTGKFIPEA